MTIPPSGALPAISELNTTADPKILALLTELKANLQAASIMDSQLTSSTIGVYRTLLRSGGLVVDTHTSGAYGMYGNVSYKSAATGNQQTLPIIYFDDADYAIASKTQKLRVRAQAGVNATASAITITVGLYPVTIAGAADTVVYTLGTVVSGSTVAFASPSASTIAQANSGDFTIPGDGVFALGYTISATGTTDSAVAVTAQLQNRSI